MEMKILTDYKDLVGKTIAFSHMAQFADQITLATTDGDVLMASFSGSDDEEFEINVFSKHRVIGVIQRHTYLQEELDRLGIFNLTAYKKEQEEKRVKEQEEYKKKQEAKERETYERLKVKFENS